MKPELGFYLVSINALKECKKILVEDEIANWLSIALKDRLGKDSLVMPEKVIVTEIAKKLQKRYEHILKSEIGRHQASLKYLDDQEQLEKLNRIEERRENEE